MIEIKEIDKTSFDDFYSLLQHRGAVDKSFYNWKYIENPVQKFPWGFIAYDSNKPCGCMGCISRIFIDSDGNQQFATWIADWYVLPEYRGQKIGIQLQKRIFELSDFAFGITNPKPAQLIAAKTGYHLQRNILLVKGLTKLRFIPKKTALNSLKQFSKDAVTFMYCKPLNKKLFALTEIAKTDQIPADFIERSPKNAFLHNQVYYNWLFKMPTEFNRKWYLCTFQTQKVLLCLEISGQHKILKVYQHNITINSKAKYRQFLNLLFRISIQLNAVRFESMDYVPFYKVGFAEKFLGRFQPFQFKINIKINYPTQLCIADKESSWVNIVTINKHNLSV